MKYLLYKKNLILAVMMLINIILLSYSAYVHSPTLNEPGHMVAGISHWKFSRFDLYSVNPPLTRMIAVLPVFCAGYEMDWIDYREGPGARCEMGLGHVFVAKNGVRSFWLFTIARWACIPFSLLGGFCCYLWAKDLFGERAGFLALALWCFSPMILGHSALITADIPAASLGVLSCYVFWQWLRSRSWHKSLIVGACLGMALLTKMTLLIFYPVFFIALLMTSCQSKYEKAKRALVFLFVIVPCSLFLINIFYGLETSFLKLKEYQFCSETFSGERKGKAGNRFSDSWLGEVPVPFPKDYIAGIDLQRRDFEHYKPSYLRGTFKETGWWYYYLYAMLVKTPLGVLGLFAILLFLKAYKKLQFPLNYQRTRGSGRGNQDVFWGLMFPGISLLFFISMQTGFSEHLRYLLPFYPLWFIWLSQIAKAESWIIIKNKGLLYSLKGASIVCIIWFIGASLWYFPHSMSYFNELAGGPSNGVKHLLGSNVDWGQDLLFLKKWMDQNSEVQTLCLDYLGGFTPSDVGIKTNQISYSKDKAKLDPGWYALSVSSLYRSGFFSDGKYKELSIQKQLNDLQSRTPVAMAGYSIYIYYITLEEANRVRRELGVPELTEANIDKSGNLAGEESGAKDARSGENEGGPSS